MELQQSLSWQYDEFKQVGRDYSSKVEVDIYDSSHADFRDIEAESNHVLDLLGVQLTDTLIDFGSGTGTFAIQWIMEGLISRSGFTIESKQIEGGVLGTYRCIKN